MHWSVRPPTGKGNTWLSCRGGERESHLGGLATGVHPFESADRAAERWPALGTEKVASFAEVLPERGEIQGSAVNQNPVLLFPVVWLP